MNQYALSKMAALVKEWAINKPLIQKIEFFGSRVKGTERPDSDLDIAIELVPNCDESNGLATWLHCKDIWEKELQEILPVKVQIEWNGGENTEIIAKGLREERYLVYEN